MIGYELSQQRQETGTSWFSFLLFQIGWLASMFSAASGRPWLGAMNAMLVMVIHVLGARPRESELVLLVIACGAGALSESWLIQSGLLRYAHEATPQAVAPYWAILIWGLFATLLNTSLRWFRGQWFSQLLTGLLGGPLAYLGGVQCGAIELTGSSRSILAISLLWAVAIPSLMLIATRLDGYDPENRL